MTAGELPRTTSGTPSYSLASSLIRTRLDELAGKVQAEYGLTTLEVAAILGDAARDWLKCAVRHEQKRNRNRIGVAGTPQEDT